MRWGIDQASTGKVQITRTLAFEQHVYVDPDLKTCYYVLVYQKFK